MSGRVQRSGVALIGFGRIGQIHFKTLVRSNRAQILYLVDEYLEPLQRAVDEWHLTDTKVIKPDQFDQVIKDDKVKGVIVCSPTPTHVSFIVRACEARKHVFCEKPIAYTVDETVLCYKNAEAHGVQLFCGLNRRFDPAFRKLYVQYKSGVAGDGQLIVHNNRDHPEPKAAFFASGSGGMFLDVGIHSVDLLTWIVGEYPTEVTAMSHASKEMYKQQNDIDVFGVMLKYQSGLIAYANSCRYAPYGYDQRLEVMGNKGCIVAENQRDDQLVVRNESGDLVTPIQNSFPERFLASYELEMEHFLDILEEKLICEVAGSDVIAVTKVCMAALESSKSGKTIKMSY